MLPPVRFVAASTSFTGVHEPDIYREAAGSPKWQAAKTQELDALDHTHTWDLIPLPPHVVLITCTWIYKVKTRSDGTIKR